jgi:hypothetical protein
MEELKKQGMESLFCPYEQALALKELGFDEPCFAWFVSKDYGIEIGMVIKSDLIKEAILAPTFSQAFRWFREKHVLVIDWNYWGHVNFGVCIKNIHLEETIVGVYKAYEEAELACLIKLIEIVKLKP